MSILKIMCPYCGEDMQVAGDGLYTPRYHDCTACDSRFIYEPLKSRVASYRLGEAPGWSDPELREIDAGGYDEQ